MKDKKLQVFVSSTFADLRQERQAAVEAILSSGHIPAGMELFTAGDESQITVIERWIDESDVYLLILGGKYGSVEKKSGKSYTHLEFEYAVSIGKPLFAVVIKPEALDAKVKKFGTKAIEQEHPKELRKFREIVTNNQIVKFWEDHKDIKLAIHETLSDFSYRKELTGWIRGDNSINGAFLAEEIARLTKENSELRSKLNSSDSSLNALYSGLTFQQLKLLLIDEEEDFDGKKINLYNFILEYGNKILNGFLAPSSLAVKLSKFKVGYLNRGNNFLMFTEDGHNFYLKALSLSKSEW